MKRLWVHEVLRVYGDRLVDDSDANWLAEQIRKTLYSRMGENMNELFSDFLERGFGVVIVKLSFCKFFVEVYLTYLFQITEVHLRNLVYCDFSDPLTDNKMYVEVRDLDNLSYVAEEYLNEYNSISKTPMNLVLFR